MDYVMDYTKIQTDSVVIVIFGDDSVAIQKEGVTTPLNRQDSIVMSLLGRAYLDAIEGAKQEPNEVFRKLVVGFGSTVPYDKLTHQVWSQETDSQTRALLSSLISRIRPQISPIAINAIYRRGYQLDPGDNITIEKGTLNF